MTNFEDEFKDLPDQQLSPAVQERHLAYLHSLPDAEVPVDLGARRTRRRRRILIGGIGAVVLIAGTGTAAALGVFDTVTNTETAYCYATASLDESTGNRMEFAVQGSAENPRDAAANGVDVCGAYWRSGVFQIGKPVNIDQPPTGTGSTVPPLVACVLPSGQAGIFPGDAATCPGLGLAAYTGK